MNNIELSIDEINSKANDILKNHGIFYVSKYIKNDKILNKLKNDVLDKIWS